MNNIEYPVMCISEKNVVIYKELSGTTKNKSKYFDFFCAILGVIYFCTNFVKIMIEKFSYI